MVFEPPAPHTPDGLASPDDFEEVKALWNQNAGAWALALHQGTDIFRQAFLDDLIYEWVGAVEGQAILEAGCGEGSTSRELAKRGAHVTGIDLAENMIQLAKTVESREQQGIRYDVGSFTHLHPYQDNQFDKVVSINVLMNIPHLEPCFQEAYRVLRPGGEFIFVICHPMSDRDGDALVYDENGLPSHLTFTQAYLDDSPFKTKPWLLGMQAIHYPRTLSAYINTLIQQGFQITQMAEPRPSEELCQQYPQHLWQWRKTPGTLMVKAQKPAV